MAQIPATGMFLSAKMAEKPLSADCRDVRHGRVPQCMACRADGDEICLYIKNRQRIVTPLPAEPIFFYYILYYLFIWDCPDTIIIVRNYLRPACTISIFLSAGLLETVRIQLS